MEFAFEGVDVAPGTRRQVDLPIARLPPGTWTTMPVVVVHGRKPGPVIWLTGALHGDELNGVAIIRELLARIDARKLAGTILAVPIVNVFGVTTASRYLPDRRDLNRSFPGSTRGSLAARLAHLFYQRVASRGELGIDFHTGSAGRANLPQLRCDLDDEETRRLAGLFGVPIVIHATARDGSLRFAARKHGIRVLLYEGGEALRFDRSVIQHGIDGTLRLLHDRGMIDTPFAAPPAPPAFSRKTTWMRAGRSGFCALDVQLGQRVEAGQRVATIIDSVGTYDKPVRSRVSGMVIGALRTALVHRGDALLHVAALGD